MTIYFHIEWLTYKIIRGKHRALSLEVVFTYRLYLEIGRTHVKTDLKQCDG